MGLPYDGVQSRIDPANGEIQVKSAGLMLGYYKEPELTRDAFTADGWLHTGDKGALDAEGNLRITGRVKDLFKTSKGKYVAPAPIEDKLVMHDGDRGLLRHRRQPRPAAGHRDAQRARRPPRPRTAPAARRSRASLAEHLKHVNASLDPHEQLDCLVVITKPGRSTTTSSRRP